MSKPLSSLLSPEPPSLRGDLSVYLSEKRMSSPGFQTEWAEKAVGPVLTQTLALSNLSKLLKVSFRHKSQAHLAYRLLTCMQHEKTASVHNLHRTQHVNKTEKIPELDLQVCSSHLTLSLGQFCKNVRPLNSPITHLALEPFCQGSLFCY